mmetsp:Transcript_4370/g.9678  ORF Transcript_4370/g.9678 Transcript_4370/m.9678 type:complete len:200 (-) Transcript_4370:88-687(-)
MEPIKNMALTVRHASKCLSVGSLYKPHKPLVVIEDDPNKRASNLPPSWKPVNNASEEEAARSCKRARPGMSRQSKQISERPNPRNANATVMGGIDTSVSALLNALNPKARVNGMAAMSVVMPIRADTESATTNGTLRLILSDHAPRRGCTHSPSVGFARYIVETTHCRTPCLLRYGTSTASTPAQPNSTVAPIVHIAKS